MSDEDVFRCDYCGQLAEIDGAYTWFTIIEKLEDGRWLWAPAVYCSPYCGRTASSRAGSARG